MISTPISSPPSYVCLRLALAVSVLGVGQSILLVSLPILLTLTGLDLLRLGVVVGVGTALFLVGAPLWGRRSDRLGRRRVMLIGLIGLLAGNSIFALAVAATAAGALSSGLCFALMLASRCLYGLTASAVVPVAQAWTADLTLGDERVRYLAQLSAGLSLGRVLGPLAVVAALLWHPLAPLLVMLLAALPALWLVARMPSPEPCDDHVAGAERGLTRGVLPFVVFGYLLQTVFGQFQYVLGPMLQVRLALDAERASSMLAALMIAAALAMLLVQTLVIRRLKPGWRTLLPTGSAILIAGTLLAAGAATLQVFLIAFLALGVSVALLVPGYTAACSLRATPSQQGRVAGTLGAAHTLGYSSGAALAGLLYSIGIDLPFYVGAGIGTVLLLYSLTQLAAVEARGEAATPTMRDRRLG